MSAHIINKMGIVKIDEQVIKTIASNAAMESYGIVGLVSATTTDSLYNLLMNENLSKGVILRVEDNKINIDLHVILEYGVKISVVSKNIIDTIKFNVEQTTGIKVDSINIIVRDIRLQNQEEF